MAEYDIKYAEHFSKNVLSNVINLVINILVGLMLVPFYLDTLGPAAYALIPLATSITSYVTIFVDVINVAIARFLTIELQKGDYNKANETFNTSFFLLLGIVICLIPVVLIIAYFAPSLFETGAISNFDVFLLFALVLGSVLITTLKSNFMEILFAFNRLDLRNYITIIQTVTQIGLLIVLFNVLGSSLSVVGFSYIAASIISFIFAVYFARKINPILKISVHFFKKSRIRDISGLSFFVLIDRMGCILQSQIALVILNVYFGAIVQAEYSMIITVASFLMSVSSIVTSTISPKVYSLAGINDDNAIIKFVSLFTKFTGYFITLPIVLLCIFSEQLLTLWVGVEYIILVPLVWILIPINYFTITLSCQVPIAISHNRMKIPALLNTFGGFVYLTFALTLPIIFDIGYYGVALASVITVLILHGVIGPIFYSYVLNGERFIFIRSALPGLISMIILMALGYAFTLVVPITNIFALIISAIIISVVYLFIIVKFLLSNIEKDIIRSCLPNAIKKSKLIQWL